MHVLIVAERYWPEVGAAPTRLQNLANGLKKEGCKVDVLTCLPNYPQGRIFKGYRYRPFKLEKHNGIELFRCWTYASVSKKPLARMAGMFSFAITMWFFAFRILRVLKYDRVIIQTPTLVTAKSAMRLFHGLYRKKCILNVSDIWPSTAVDMGAIREGSAPHRYLLKCEEYLYRKADAVMGQSQEILDHIAQQKHHPEKSFLYRNLPTTLPATQPRPAHKPFRIVFSGMLGVAQDVASIVQNVPFKELDVEFHIIGGGQQLPIIQQYIKEHPDCNVTAHGFVAKEDMPSWLVQYDACIVPLATYIRGAVPSKIYDSLPYGLPIIFCGKGEGARIIEDNQVGITCMPSDYKAITECIKRLRDLSEQEYAALQANCFKMSHEQLNFDKQMHECIDFIS